MQSYKNTLNQKLINVKSKEQLENRGNPKTDDSENERKGLKNRGSMGPTHLSTQRYMLL